MQLKDYLFKELDKKVEDLSRELCELHHNPNKERMAEIGRSICRTVASKDFLELTDLDDAHYRVGIRPKEGTPVLIAYRGKLEEAIKAAEVKFSAYKKDAEYLVKIVLGNKEYKIPEEYWR
ncbi:hypothetical protein GF336_03165 [Candidatus Woesearchaeota archaeon]|nr:hypothetical protein [Candidatus Woesearchaeota archaeon]